MGDLFGALNRTGRSIEDSPVSAAALGEMLDLMADGTINGRIGKDLFEAMVESGEPPRRHRGGARPAPGHRHGRDRRRDRGGPAANGDKVAQYRSGKDKLFGFFVGQVMKATAGKGNPALINEGR